MFNSQVKTEALKYSQAHAGGEGQGSKAVVLQTIFEMLAKYLSISQ
jgi:hypothetical protein